MFRVTGKKCIECEKTFMPERKWQKYCTKNCRWKNRVRRNPEKTKILCKLRMRRWRNNSYNAMAEKKRWKIYYPRYFQRIMEYNKKVKIEHPKIIKARAMICNLLRSGKIKKNPCEKCGTTLKIQAHHSDYSKPLMVKWLCAKHHRQLHQTTL